MKRWNTDVERVPADGKLYYIGWSNPLTLRNPLTWFAYSWGNPGGLVGATFGFRVFGFEFEGRNPRRGQL